MRDGVIGLNRKTNYRYILNEKLIFIFLDIGKQSSV